LPAAIEEKCVALTQRLGLRFGCIDMIVTPEDKYVFLEINPNGQWRWVQELTGMPIAEAIADLLIHAEA
jgi:glutathione synthase/RimK-type ligase-like ATP-grasp enzyme